MTFWDYFTWWGSANNDEGWFTGGGGGTSSGSGASGEYDFYTLFGFWFVTNVFDSDGKQEISLSWGATFEKFAKDVDEFREYLLQPVLYVCEQHEIPLTMEEEDAMIDWLLNNGAPRDYAAFVQFLPVHIQAHLYNHPDDWALLFAWYWSFLFDYVKKAPWYAMDIGVLGDEKYIVFADMEVLEHRTAAPDGGLAPNYVFSDTHFVIEARGRSTYSNLYTLDLRLWNDAMINGQDIDALLEFRRAAEPSGASDALDPDPNGQRGKREFFKARKQPAITWKYEEDAPPYPVGSTVNVLAPLWSTSYWDSYSGGMTWYPAHYSPKLFHYLTGDALPAAYPLAFGSDDVSANGSIAVPGGGDATYGHIPSGSPDHETVVRYPRNPEDPSFAALLNETQVQWYANGRSGYFSCRPRWAQGVYFRIIKIPFPGEGAGKISIIPALTCLSLFFQGGR